MSGALVTRANAKVLPFRDASVDLIVTSPPYWAQRSYRDGGEHYDGQIGSEPHPQEFLENLWAVMAECWRVLKPQGVCFVNLGDKRAGSGGNNQSGLKDPRLTAVTVQATGEQTSGFRGGPRRYLQTHFGRRKTRQLLPHRFAIGCEDGLADPEGKGWIVSDYVWAKPNGLPESVTDRCRDSHEYLFQLTKSERWFAAMDEIRVPGAYINDNRHERGPRIRYDGVIPSGNTTNGNPLGALPPSVWNIATEPLIVPEWAQERLDLPDHFAAFPTELVRRCILGWSPSGICTACDEPRRPVVTREFNGEFNDTEALKQRKRLDGVQSGGIDKVTLGRTQHLRREQTGYACACPDTSAPTRPARVLDVFGGTGTTAMVARSLGRMGYSIDLSMDYSRLARWRVFESGHGSKAIARTNAEAQGALL